MRSLAPACPRLGELRGASALQDTAIAPQERLANSTGFLLQGTPGAEVGRLDSSDGGTFEWAV
ncbi:hypothetical protein IT575_13980 [bacterium]|nr:hypothetical protein [bacterium]